MKKLQLFVLVCGLGLTGAVAHAQLGGNVGDGSCTDSPENPTIVLAAIGSSGAGLAALRVRMRARRSRKQ